MTAAAVPALAAEISLEDAGCLAVEASGPYMDRHIPLEDGMARDDLLGINGTDKSTEEANQTILNACYRLLWILGGLLTLVH